MKMQNSGSAWRRIFILFNLIPLMAGAQQAEKDTFLLFYLGGQSNMDGYGYNRDLEANLAGDYSGVYIYHGNTMSDNGPLGGQGIWTEIKPGHGIGFSSDGKRNQYSNRFGPELSFASRMKELHPGKKIALIKYSKGGTSIDTAVGSFGYWEPDFCGVNGINQYDHFLQTLRFAFSAPDINNDGTEDILKPCGIVWMQGESDANSEISAKRYFVNLKRLMDLIRAALREDDLPVVIGKISDSGNNEKGKIWKYGELIQHGQEEFVRKDSRSAIVRDTKYYLYSDPWHYDSAGYIDLGKKMAEALNQLIP